MSDPSSPKRLKTQGSVEVPVDGPPNATVEHGNRALEHACGIQEYANAALPGFNGILKQR